MIFSFLLGVFGSIIASMIFLAALRSFRPKLEISNVIARNKSDGVKKFTIKILNKGKRSVVDLRFELLLMTKQSIKGGELRKATVIPLAKNHAFILYGFSHGDREFRYARRINISDDLDKTWRTDDQQYLLFRVYAHDEVSGLAKLFETEFRTKRNSIEDGIFTGGDTFEVT